MVYNLVLRHLKWFPNYFEVLATVPFSFYYRYVRLRAGSMKLAARIYCTIKWN